MSTFDAVARTWDKNLMHIERSESITREMLKLIPINTGMKALEFGAGTGLLSFALKQHLSEILLVDNSKEMVKVAKEKIGREKAMNMKALYFDLTAKNSFKKKFDIIYSQMVLHHVMDIQAILKRFHEILNPNGYLAIADLFKEDGSFHGEGFDGHCGFEMDELKLLCEKAGFSSINYKTCYVIEREGMLGEKQSYPLFLLTAKK